MAEDLGGLFDSDPGFLEELASGSRGNTESGIISQPGGAPQTGMIGQPQVPLQNIAMVNQIQQQQGFGNNMGGDAFPTSGGQFQQQQISNVPFNQFGNQMGQQIPMVQGQGPRPMQDPQHSHVNRMMSPHRNSQFVESQSGIGAQQSQGQFQIRMVAPAGPRLPNPQQPMMMGQGQMQNWNVQMFSTQQQGQNQYLSHHDYAIPSSTFSNNNFQTQMMGSQGTYVQPMTSPNGLQGTSQPQQNRTAVPQQAVFANTQMQFGQNFSAPQPVLNSDQIIMQQQQQQQQFMQRHPQPHNPVQVQQFRFQQSPQVQQGMVDNAQQNIVRFSQTSPNQGSVQHRLPFTTMSQQRQNVPMLSPRPTPPPPSPSGSQGVLSPTGSTSISQTNFVQNVGLPSGNSGNLFNQGANTEISVNDMNQQKQFTLQGQVNPMMSPPQGATKVNLIMSPQGGNTNNLSQIASPNSKPNNNCIPVSVNTSANATSSSNNFASGPNQVSPSNKVLSPNMNPQNVNQEIQSLNQQIQQLYNMPQTQETQQKMLDLQERLRTIKSQQMLTTQRQSQQQQQPQQQASSQVLTSQTVLTNQTNATAQQGITQDNLTEQPPKSTQIQNASMQQQQQGVTIQQINFAGQQQNAFSVQQQNPSAPQQPGMNMQLRPAGTVQQQGAIRHPVGPVQQQGPPGQQGLTFKINTQPGQKIQFVRGPAQPGGGPQKIFIIQQPQVANQQAPVQQLQQQQQQQQPTVPLPVPATVNVSQPVTSTQTLLKTIPQPQHVIINTSLSSGGNAQLGKTQVVQNITAVRPQRLPVPVQVQIPQPVVQNSTVQPQSVQNTVSQPQAVQNTPVQIVRENEQDGGSNISQQQEKANKIIAEAIAKAQRDGTVSAIPRVLSPPELPSTLADVDNPESTSTPTDTPVKEKKKRKPRESKKGGSPRKRKEKVKVEATDETSNVDVENMAEEAAEEVKKEKKKRKREPVERKPRGEKTWKQSGKRSKKPPATFLKSRKRKRRGSSDGSDVEIKFTPPPSPENDELKRRSGRHTKRKKYMDELDLNLSDEDTVDAPDTTEGAVVKPVQLFVENPAEEDAVVVEKILGSRMRTRDADVSNDEDEEDDVEEYFVKYKNFSYLHCEWKTEKELMKDKRIPGKIRRFKMKKAHANNYFSAMEEDELFNPEYVEVDRVLEESVTLDPNTDEEVTHYLVKWRGLPYEDSTWELQQDVDPEKVRLFKKVRELPPEEEREHVPRPSSGSEWEALKETHTYKGDNTLREYQLEGVNWLTFSWYKRQNCILADEMGLGKTIQSIAFLHEIFNYGIKGPFLVIAPLSTIANWMREFDVWTDMNVIVYHGTSPSRFMLQEYEMYYKDKNGHKIIDFYKFHVIITTYELVISDLEVLRDIDWRCVIIDEAHRLKNKNCRLMEGLRFFDFEHKVLLSGTPLQNNVEELFSLLNFLEPSQFHSSEAFLAEFGTLKTEEQVDKLKALLKPMMLRRLKEDVEKNLAAKEETIIEVELTNIQKKYYRAILERNFSFLHKGSQSSTNVPNLMNTMMELRKCCNHPYLINGAEENILSEMKTKQQQTFEPDPIVHAMIQASGKFVLLDKLLPKLKQSGHKVLIFSQMIRVLDILEDYLVHKRYLYERIDGRITGNLRQEAIDRFSKPDSDRFVFLLCTRAGGLGINLTAADTVIIYDSDWNPQNDLQAQARCHRIGQSRMVKVYRLITRNSYEREMFDRASMKLGLDKAVLQSMGGEKINPQAQLSKREIEELLRKGAYGALMEDDNAGDAFCEEDIDQILQRRTQVIQIESEGKGSTFAKASFSMTSNRDDIDINDPEFWEKWAKKADVNVDAGDKELIIEEPRVRKKTTRYGNDNGVVDMSDLSSSSDTDTDSKSGTGRGRRGRRRQDEDTDFESERHVAKSHGPGYGRSELFKVEKGLLVYGWGRWSNIVSHGNWKRHMEEKDVEKVSRAILIYSLQHYKGDERIKEFIWDLVSPAGEASLKNHSGLSAPVPRGRKGKKNRDVKEDKSFSREEAIAGLKVDPNVVLGDNGYKKHLHRHSNKVLLRVRTLYYLKQEVIGDAAEQIAKGASVVDINIPLPAVEVDPPAYWWDEDADKSLLIGVYKHGYEKYNLMRQDPALTFLLRCGPPDGAALAAEMKDDDDDDEKADQSIVNDNEEEDESVLSASDVSSAKPSSAKTPAETNGEEEEKLPFPTASDLNTRLRRIITNYQRDYKKQQQKKEQQAKKIEKRERLDAMIRERETRRRETQQRWVRREETDFYRVVSTYGIEFDRHKGRYVWDKFRVMAKLDNKSDDQLTEYFISFYHMCLRVCRKIKEDAYPPTPLYVESITEERANRCIARIDLLSKIREEIIVHPKFEERIKLCKTSYDLPAWWVNGKHDRDLVIGAAKHGLARTYDFILNDPLLSFGEYCKYEPTSQPNSPANFRMFGKDVGKTKDASKLSEEKQDNSETKVKDEKSEGSEVKKESQGEEDIKPPLKFLEDDDDDTLSNDHIPAEVKTTILMSDFIKKEDKGDDVVESLKKESVKKELKKESVEKELPGSEEEDIKPLCLKTDVKQEKDEKMEEKESEEQKEIKQEKDELLKEKEETAEIKKEEKDDTAGGLKDDEEDEEVRRTFEEGEHSRAELLKKVKEGLSTQWPKDRVVFHRLEQICFCAETGEWPFGKKMPNQHILGIDSGSASPVMSRTPTLTPSRDEETSSALQEMVKAKTKLEKDFEVQLSEGDGLKLTFHKRAKGKQRQEETLEAEKAARIQQILAQSVAASTASSDESRPDSTLSTSQVSGPLPWQPHSPYFFLTQTPDSLFMNGSPSAEAELLMNQSLIEQGLMYPGRRRGRKRKAEKLAEIAMAEALARRQTARAIAAYEPDERVPVINLEDGSRLSGSTAPMKKDLDVWLDQHPGYVIDRVEDDLEEGEIVSDYPERRRGRKPKVDPAFLDVDKLTGEENVSVINRLTGKKITGAKAPPLRYLAEWLEQNPMWDVDPKWSELVRAKGSLPKQLLPRIVTPNRRGRGRPARDSPVSHSMLGSSDPHTAAALAASMEAMNAAQLMAAGVPKLPLPFGSLPGLGLNPLFGLSGIGIPGLPGTSPSSKDSDSKRKDLEEKEGSKGESKSLSPHPSFPMLYNPLLYNPLLAAQGLGGFPLPTSLSSQLPGLNSRLINGHTHSDSEEEPKVSKSRTASEQFEQDEAEDLSVKSEKKVIENLQEAHSSGKQKPEKVLDDSEQPCDLSMKSKPKEEPQTKIIGSDKLSRIVDSLKDRVNKMDGKPMTSLSDKVKESKKSKLDSLLFSLSQEKQSNLPEVSSPPPERRPSITDRRPSSSEKQVVSALDRHSSSKLTSHSEGSLTKKSSLSSPISQTSSQGVKPSTKEPVPQIVQELLAAKQLKDAAKLQKEAELAAKQQKAIEALVAKQRQIEDVLFLKKQAADTKLLKQKASSCERGEKMDTPEKEEEEKDT